MKSVEGSIAIHNLCAFAALRENDNLADLRTSCLPKPGTILDFLMRYWVFLFSCNLMWALQFTCIKLVQDQVGSLFTVWGPMTLAILMLYPLILSERWKEG